MASLRFSIIAFFIFFLSASFAALDPSAAKFSKCLSDSIQPSVPISSILFTPDNVSFNSVLNLTAQNLRFARPSVPKPVLIFTPSAEDQVPAAVICAKQLNIQIRTRSGGHDYEGLSYTGLEKNLFLVIDLVKLRSIDVNATDKTAWVQAGASTGEVYYRISEKSKQLAFPAGVCTTLGMGGHISGGAYGTMLRKFGIGADHVLDARIVTADGKLLDRKSMSDDLFWAIRGGGGASFGVILAWKIELVDIPETVTMFSVPKTLEQGATNLLVKWQNVAYKLDEDLFIRLLIQPIKSGGNRTIQTEYQALYLGPKDKLQAIMEQAFPELGVKAEDYTEVTWIQSVLEFAGYGANTPPEFLLKVKPRMKAYFKAKSDYVKAPIPSSGLEGLWKLLLTEDMPQFILNPYGGIMDRIPEDAIPFPHRKGINFKIQYLSYWFDATDETAAKHVSWMRKASDYLKKYVSQYPREAFLNYRDLDLGMNEDGKFSVEEARVWGEKYFKNNFDRLVKTKTEVDPGNFFRYEQSIPPSK